MPNPPPAPGYAELHCLSNFSFQRGASTAKELFERARRLGYRALAITDECTLAGIVRAYEAARELELPLIVGAEFNLVDGPRFVLLVEDAARLRQPVPPDHARAARGGEGRVPVDARGPRGASARGIAGAVAARFPTLDFSLPLEGGGQGGGGPACKVVSENVDPSPRKSETARQTWSPPPQPSPLKGEGEERGAGNEAGKHDRDDGRCNDDDSRKNINIKVIVVGVDASRHTHARRRRMAPRPVPATLLAGAGAAPRPARCGNRGGHARVVGAGGDSPGRLRRRAHARAAAQGAAGHAGRDPARRSGGRGRPRAVAQRRAPPAPPRGPRAAVSRRRAGRERTHRRALPLLAGRTALRVSARTGAARPAAQKRTCANSPSRACAGASRWARRPRCGPRSSTSWR